MVRSALAQLLNLEPDLRVCAEAGTPEQALVLARELRPDAILLDYHLDASDDGARLIGLLRQTNRPPPRILALSLLKEEQVGERALRAGAHGFIDKSADTASLVAALRVVLGGGYYLSQALQAKLLDCFEGPAGAAVPAASPEAALTERELQVYRLIGAGESMEAIGRRLGVSARTVASHREHIKNKLGLIDAEGVEERAARWLRGAAAVSAGRSPP